MALTFMGRRATGLPSSRPIPLAELEDGEYGVPDVFVDLIRSKEYSFLARYTIPNVVERKEYALGRSSVQLKAYEDWQNVTKELSLCALEMKAYVYWKYIAMEQKDRACVSFCQCCVTYVELTEKSNRFLGEDVHVRIKKTEIVRMFRSLALNLQELDSFDFYLEMVLRRKFDQYFAKITKFGAESADVLYQLQGAHITKGDCDITANLSKYGDNLSTTIEANDYSSVVMTYDPHIDPALIARDPRPAVRAQKFREINKVVNSNTSIMPLKLEHWVIIKDRNGPTVVLEMHANPLVIKHFLVVLQDHDITEP